VKSNIVIIFVTTANEQDAASIGKHLVEEGLAACANIIPQIRSIYRWKGDICDESEALIMVKSREDLFERIRSRIRELHRYEVPEITAISLEKGDADYLQWIETVTGKGD
jgi:periplasmic divalent cation tolerance protein